MSGLVIVGCGEDTSGEEEVGGNCLEAGTQVEIAANHEHSMLVDRGDVETGSTKTYSIQGRSSHNHTVTLTEAHFAKLSENISVTVKSTSDGTHTHEITVRCAG